MVLFVYHACQSVLHNAAGDPRSAVVVSHLAAAALRMIMAGWVDHSTIVIQTIS